MDPGSRSRPETGPFFRSQAGTSTRAKRSTRRRPGQHRPFRRQGHSGPLPVRHAIRNQGLPARHLLRPQRLPEPGGGQRVAAGSRRNRAQRLRSAEFSEIPRAGRPQVPPRIPGHLGRLPERLLPAANQGHRHHRCRGAGNYERGLFPMRRLHRILLGAGDRNGRSKRPAPHRHACPPRSRSPAAPSRINP